MPFNVHLADNEDPLIVAQPVQRRSAIASNLAEFWKGLSFGLGVVFVLLAAYATYLHVNGFADMKALVSYWMSRG